MANEVTVHIKTRDDEARAGMKAFEEEAKASGERSGSGFSQKFKSAMGNIGKGGGLFAGLSAGLAGASPLAGLALAVGSFSAIAVPELTKVQSAMSATGTAGQKAMQQLSGPEKELVPALQSIHTAFDGIKTALAPVVDHTIALGAHLVSDLMPALKVMASAGGKVIDSFLKPFDALVRSDTFSKFIKTMADGAVQIGAVLGPALVNLLKVLMQLFVQVMPSGVQILQVLLPLIVQIATDLTPVIAFVAKVVAGMLDWLNANHLLIPALAALSVALIAAMDTNPIGLLLTAIALLVTGIVEFAKHWSQIWAEVKQIVGDAVNWVKAHWNLIFDILTGPLGIAIAWIVSHFGQITGVVSRVVGFVRNVWSDIYNAIVSPVWDATKAVFNFFNQILSFAASIPSRIGHFLGSIGSGALHMLGFEHGGIVGAAATGGNRSGMVMVGEHGRELVSLPTGSKVHSNPDTERMMSGSGGGQVTISFDFGGSGSDELIKLLRNSIRVKGGNVQTVLGH